MDKQNLKANDELRSRIIEKAKKGNHSSVYAGFDVEAASVYRVIQIANSKPYVTISASRNELNAAENNERNEQLLSEIKASGLYAYEMIGGFEEKRPDNTLFQVVESSFFVPFNGGNLSDFISLFRELLAKYNQEAILVGLPESYWKSDIKDLVAGGHYFIYVSGKVVKIGTKAVIQTFDKYGSIAIDPKKNRIIDWVIAGVTTPNGSKGCFAMDRVGLKWFWDSFKQPEIVTNNETVKRAIAKIVSK